MLSGWIRRDRITGLARFTEHYINKTFTSSQSRGEPAPQSGVLGRGKKYGMDWE
jgi:hypothetical protein